MTNNCGLLLQCYVWRNASSVFLLSQKWLCMCASNLIYLQKLLEVCGSLISQQGLRTQCCVWCKCYLYDISVTPGGVSAW